jgi:AcrR family transcriptional regulator
VLVRERFPIGELIERTGVPAATIHHYLRRGLLPPPRRIAPNRFLYDERHAQGLRLIRVLRERRGLPLEVIRQILPDLLGLGEDQAFRGEMWDRAVGAHLARFGRRSPGARLLAAAMDAFARRGYADVNVDDICKAARIAKGSFYRHYRSKEELFFAVAEAAGGEVVEGVAQAVSSAPISPEAAAGPLARALEPRLAIFLELFTRAVQRRPGYPATARRLFTGLAYRLGELLGAADPLGAGARALQLATVRVLRRALEPSPLAALGVEEEGAGAEPT